MHDPVYEVRDAVHGFVKLTNAERDIVDTPTFQRLRDIRQLAMGHMVYPGANHTRFEHSLGCVHLSSLIMGLLQERQGRNGRPTFSEAFDADDHAVKRGGKILRLASLLHDLGHPPFSHSGENLLPEEETDGTKWRIDHEEMTARLIRSPDIAQRIEKHFGSHGITPEDVIAVATKPSLAGKPGFDTPWHAFLNEILTGELGSDRMDYLLRDAHHSGQRSGSFDYLKLVNAMTLVQRPEQEGEGFKLGLDEGGWLVAEQMVVARYLMYIAMYFHKTKRIYEMHLEDFITAWLADREGDPRWPSDPEKYIKLTDSVVLAAITQAANSVGAAGHAHARPFVDRTHLRLAKELVLADNYLLASDRRVPDRARFDNLWEHVSIVLGPEAPLRRDAVDHTATKFFGADTKILVLLEGQPRYIDDLSEIVRGMSSRIWRGRVYAGSRILSDAKAACARFLEENPQRLEDVNHDQPGAR